MNSHKEQVFRTCAVALWKSETLSSGEMSLRVGRLTGVREECSSAPDLMDITLEWTEAPVKRDWGWGERPHPFKSVSERAWESSGQVGVAKVGGYSSGSVSDWLRE